MSFGTMAKPFHAGKAAMNAVIAVKLAQEGFVASPEALDSREGLARAFVQDRSVGFVPIDNSPWQILLNTFKPYASCLLTHPAIDCARAIAGAEQASRIKSITARVHPLAIRLAGKTKPVTPLETSAEAAKSFATAARTFSPSGLFLSIL